MQWIQTWDIPIYKEWAKKRRGQEVYELLILRKESTRYLLARADLIFKSEGLPDFKILEPLYCDTEEEAMKKMNGNKELNQKVKNKRYNYREFK